MDTNPEIPEQALRARQRYQRYIDGKPVHIIRAECKLINDRLYYFLDGLPQKDGTTLLPPMAIGFADEHAAINGWRSPREPLDAFASFAGFES